MGLNQRLSMVAGLAALITIVAAADVRAQGQVRSARLVASLSGEGAAADVTIEYHLSLDGSAVVPVELLGFAGATAFEFRVDGIDTPTVLEPATGSRRTTSLSLTPDADGRDRLVTLSYVVDLAVEEDAGAVHGRIPVLSMSLPPVDGAGDVFSAELRLPSNWVVSEGFPTGLRRTDDGRYSVTLPVVPALVSIRARADGAWRPGVPLALDLLAALILLGFAYRGWRHLHAVSR